MKARFLAAVGVLYIALGIWCAVQPEATSATVGFTLQPGAGQSEFLTVYGGLELALGIIFLWPLYKPTVAEFSLFACLVVHSCLVFFRTISFFAFTDIPSTTYFLAGSEWIVLLGAATLFLRDRPAPTYDSSPET